MKKGNKKITLFGLALSFLFIFTALKYQTHFPYKEAGLTERQAAAYLLERLTYGARPGDVDKVIKMGIENWFNHQLNADLPDNKLNDILSPYPVLTMSNDDILKLYPKPGMILYEAKEAGVIDNIKNVNRDDPEFRRAIKNFMNEKGYKPPRELLGTLYGQKIIRALYSENQLKEILTDFWFNHFNVSITNNQAREYVLTYERDAIRPYVLGKFRDLLEATAKHPAMLLYLNNAESSANPGQKTTVQYILEKRLNNSPFSFRFQGRREQMMQRIRQMNNNRKQKGLNENYGRELMELHTLGVDGGYTQQDVIEVARAFTGWTILPSGKNKEKFEEQIEKGKKFGLVVDDQFVFRPDLHDAGEKIVLGNKIPAGGGIQDGEKILDILASSPATAHHISFELAQKFVSDNPPESLVKRLTQKFIETNGDIKELMRTIVESPEFWSKDARRAKIKSPFELAISALRALNAEVQNPFPLAQWINKMGEPLYAYQAPTGYPDNARYWINTGSLLNRMNFGLNLAKGKIHGISFDLAELNNYREPESLEAALKIYARIMMPERDLTETVSMLTPNLTDPEFFKKISDKASSNHSSEKFQTTIANDSTFDDDLVNGDNTDDTKDLSKIMNGKVNSQSLANVVGLIVGSPEFQRR